MDKKLKNLDIAAERIKRAAAGKEKIIIYADSDADGICSAVILQEAIKSLGGTIAMVLFPNREEDGYGINARALELVKGQAPALFITLDLGISNNNEIAALNKMGFEVIVVDHHQPPDILPPASILIDPKQPGDESGVIYLANVGLTFKLAEELLGAGMSVAQRNGFLELTALATISDMVPQIEENIGYIQEGLRSLPKSFRPGFAAFYAVLPAADSQTHMRIIGAINSAESVDFNNSAFGLLTTSDAAQARELVENLLGRVRQKQMRIESIVQEVERRISLHPDEAIIFEGDPAWKLVLAGPVCSIIAQKYGKPTFIYKKMDTESAGSVRSLKEGQNSVDAMKSCADILITYGGHPKASGFRIKNENLEKFKEGLIKYFGK